MIPFHNAMSIAAGASSARTRAEFEAHIQSVSVSSTEFTIIYNGAYNLVYAGGDTLSYGSPWGSIGSCAGDLGKLVAHCFPDELTRLSQVGRRVMITGAVYDNVDSMPEVSRNGVTTSGINFDELNPSMRVYEFLYFDDVLGAQKMNPQLMSGPTPYTWTP